MIAALKQSVAQTFRSVQREQREFLAGSRSDRFDWQVTLILLVTPVLLTVQYYFVTHRLDWEFLRWTVQPRDMEVVRLMYWALANSALYVVVPVFLIKVVLRRPLRDYGLEVRGVFQGWRLYAAMLAVVLPLVFLASFSPSFQRTYPFYHLFSHESLWPRFVAWEVAYALQFLSLEFFFRGFLVHGLRRRFGIYAILIMAIPYCMIHLGKPLPEALGAIVAGVVLGFMSLKTRSIWLGGAVHITVAWTMDLLALLHR